MKTTLNEVINKIGAEVAASKSRLGLWSEENPVEPWVWRRTNK